MNKLYFEALKKLPKRFIDDETDVLDWYGRSIIASNPKYQPIVYRYGKWSKIKIKPEVFLK